jgi:hypothetical protein
MKNILFREFGWAIGAALLLLLVLFFGSKGPQFIYAMF